MSRHALDWRMKEWAYDRWCKGYTLAEIADALYVHERTVQRALKGQKKVRKPLFYDFKVEVQADVE